MISVITATYNAVEHLPQLIESLRNQEDKDFEWVVADGASTDGTIELLESIRDLNIKITSQEDFGIYDALNRGIKASLYDFYLVVGADDSLYPNAIRDYKSSIDDSVDLVTASYHKNTEIIKPRNMPLWLVGMSKFISGHAVGCVIRRSLHNELGFYSRKYPICADQLFFLRLIGKQGRIKFIDRIVGHFNDQGVSSMDLLGITTESYRVRVESGLNLYTQTILFVLRLLKRFPLIYKNAMRKS